MPEVNSPDGLELIQLSGEIVQAYVSHNSVTTTDVPRLIADVHAALQRLVSPTAAEAPSAPIPAVSIRKSVTPDFIVCLEDGKKFKSMKRHLSQLGMTPDEYRSKWGLPPDYPMVAPNYSATRSALAKSAGLGRKAGPTTARGTRVRAKA
ncbi:MAG: MucR family transcriptional regulator [Devosia nanyangense]|uniref:MucR family transcriptional regulator n=1 Tax=Devosia nanyangense TaxID=1228055 RepID=A0A933NZH4_9HYPH|nr:MucR family transcriptional regulator [Devosia nanyangense]